LVPRHGSSDLDDGSGYYYPFATYAEALAFSQRTEGAENRSRSFDSWNTSTNLILVSIVTLTKCASPNGQWNSFAVLDACRLRFLTFWRQRARQ